MAEFYLADDGGLDSLVDDFASYPELIGPAIDGVLHNDGAKLIKEGIDAFIPRSGRRWRGKGAPARGAEWQRVDTAPLSVTVATSTKYHYLYFPDDGSNTRRHVGNRQMFRRGLEAAAPTVVEKIQGALAEALGEEG